MLKAQRHAYRYKHICILSIRELYLNVYKETVYGFLCIMDERFKHFCCVARCSCFCAWSTLVPHDCGNHHLTPFSSLFKVSLTSFLSFSPSIKSQTPSARSYFLSLFSAPLSPSSETSLGYSWKVLNNQQLLMFEILFHILIVESYTVPDSSHEV